MPELKEPRGVVLERLRALGAGDQAIALWGELCGERIEPDDDDDLDDA
jgi:hypothetical protein